MSPNKIFDPRDLIGAPFTQCSFCESEDTLGVLSIQNNSFTKRCKKCFKDQRFYLPEIKKRTIYLDQFVISNLMIVHNKKLDAYKRLNNKEFWHDLDNKLSEAISKQQIVCPSSSYHQTESSLSKYYEQIDKTHTHISSGYSFFSKQRILLQQIEKDISNWISGNQSDLLLEATEISYENFNEWHNKYIVKVNYDISDEWITELRKEKEKVSSSFSDLFKRWQKMKQFDYDTSYNNQLLEFGKSFYRMGMRHYADLAQLQRNPNNVDIDPNIMLKVPFLTHVLEILQSKFNSENVYSKLAEYMMGDRPINIPYNNIFSVLNSSMARKAFHGQKKIPNQGTTYDIELVSCYMPYCDAIFIDKKVHSLLKENPASEYLEYPTKLFSMNNKEDFLLYLDEIINDISEEFYQYLNSVYDIK